MLRIHRLVGLGFWILARPIVAQQPTRVQLADSSAKRILELAKDANMLRPILRQVTKSQPEGKLDELGDSLASRSIARAAKADLEGLRELGESGRRLDSQSGGAQGTPYAGALDRLIRIHSEAPASAYVTRSQALVEMNYVVGFDRARRYLLSVATSTDPTAHSAMEQLVMDADVRFRGMALDPGDRESTRLKLKQLWDRASDSALVQSKRTNSAVNVVVPDRNAYWVLYQFARQQKWTQ